MCLTCKVNVNLNDNDNDNVNVKDKHKVNVNGFHSQTTVDDNDNDNDNANDNTNGNNNENDNVNFNDNVNWTPSMFHHDNLNDYVKIKIIDKDKDNFIYLSGEKHQRGKSNSKKILVTIFLLILTGI